MSSSFKVIPGLKPCKAGHTSQRVYLSNRRCYECHLEDNRIRKQKQRKHDRLTNPALALWKYARHRAKRLKVPFDLQPEDVIVPELCPCCKLPFVLGAPLGRPVPQTPSLDRFRPELGYVKKNVAVICFRCNTLKRDATATELENVAQWMKVNAAAA